MAKNYVFERFSDDYYRLINQTGVQQALPKAEGNENFNTCWDGALGPDGVFYFTLSSEAGRSDHAKLVRYNREQNKIEDCFYAGDLILPNPRNLPASKLHTSINFLPDGRVIATTHSTDRAKHHPEWMPFGHHNHVWEGFPGSHILVYDPKTGKSENWGIPVPRESIYGAKYDPKHNRLYMIGFMRGHVYSYDLDTKKVTDLGKAAELYCYRLSLGADGNIYGCTKSGYYFRVNTELNKLEDLNFRVPDYPGNYVNNTWYRYMTCARNHPSGKFMYMTNLCADDLWKLDFETLEITSAGNRTPKDGLYEYPNEYCTHGVDSFVIDKYNVLWYNLYIWNVVPTEDIVYGGLNYLIRWDIENGKEPECLGAIGTPERAHRLTTAMEYDEKNDILYCVDVGIGFGADGPCVLSIDLAKFRENMYIPGPVAQDERLRPRPLTEEEKKQRDIRIKKKAGEEVTANNPYQAFPIEDCYPVRIWREVPHTNIEDSKVIGMCYDEDDILHVLTGASLCAETASYVFKIKYRDVIERLNFSELDPEYKEWLLKNIKPGELKFNRNVKLPEATGRRYRAVASASVEWNNGREIVGTMDALLAIVSPDDKVYSLGHAAAYGPIRCMCTNKAKTKLWGVAGDPEDMGYVFYYDDEVGLKQLGIINYNTHGYYGTTASNELSSIVLNNAEDTLAIGSIDRIATVHIIDLKK
ncbi:MAG: hypothetical protein ACOX22_00530 [Caldicoprobacterales bacterium]